MYVMLSDNVKLLAYELRLHVGIPEFWGQRTFSSAVALPKGGRPGITRA